MRPPNTPVSRSSPRKGGSKKKKKIGEFYFHFWGGGGGGFFFFFFFFWEPVSVIGTILSAVPRLKERGPDGHRSVYRARSVTLPRQMLMACYPQQVEMTKSEVT